MKYNHKNYLLDVATKLKDIEHTIENPRFHRIYGIGDIEEFIGNQTLTKGYHLLCEIRDDENFIDFDSNNLTNRGYYGFYVAYNFEGGNFDSKETAKINCKTVAEKIISKYIKDFEEDNALSIPNRVGLADLELSSFTITTLPTIADYYMLCFVSFTKREPSEIAYNANDWNT